MTTKKGEDIRIRFWKSIAKEVCEHFDIDLSSWLNATKQIVLRSTNAKAVTVRPQRFQKVNYDRIRHEFQPTEQWTALEMNRRTFWHRFLIMAECYEVRTQKLSRFEHNDHCRKSSMIGFVITDSSLRIRCLCTNPNTTDQAGKHVLVRQIDFVEKMWKTFYLDQLDDLNLFKPNLSGSVRGCLGLVG